MNRQGDLKIIKIESLPKRAKRKQDNILVYGEVTGHMHRVVNGEPYEYGDRLFVNANSLTTIIHDEHNPIELGEGVYEIKRQREYNSGNMTRLVVD